MWNEIQGLSPVLLFFILLYIGANVAVLLCVHRAVRRNRLINREVTEAQVEQIRHLADDALKRFDRLEDSLQELRNMIQALREDPDAQSSAPTSGPQSSADWLALVNDAMKGEQEILYKHLMETADVHIIDFADQYLHLNNHAYAEFADHSSGGCLLVPNQDLPDNYLVFPLPNGGDWFSQHRDLLSAIFLIQGDPDTHRAAPYLQRPAIVCRNICGTDANQVIYRIVQKGLIVC